MNKTLSNFGEAMGLIALTAQILGLALNTTPADACKLWPAIAHVRDLAHIRT